MPYRNRDDLLANRRDYYRRNRAAKLAASRADYPASNARRREKTRRTNEARRAAVLASAAAEGHEEEGQVGIPRQLSAMLGDDAGALSQYTGKLGRRQRHLILWLYRQRELILDGAAEDWLKAEVRRVGVPWQVQGSRNFQEACRCGIMKLEGRGLVLRQNIHGHGKGRKGSAPQLRESADDPHGWRTTHVQLLPHGLLLGRRLWDRLVTRQRLAAWPTLPPDQRTAVIMALIEWRCRAFKNPKKDVLALMRCHENGTHPAESLPWVRRFGLDEITWQEVPLRLENNIP
jgi:hypothetical protein